MMTDRQAGERTGRERLVRVFDPAMCCSTGVCGPDVDTDLVRFAADLDWLTSGGVRVERFNLAQQPGAFAADTRVRGVLQEHGEAGLPVVIVDGDVKSLGSYPDRALLAAWTGREVEPTVWGEDVAELAGIAASVAAGCVSCLSTHEQRARALGVRSGDIRAAIAVGVRVREAAQTRIDQHAERLTRRAEERASEPAPVGAPGAARPGCC